ncbi:unnamed protein product [Toxocara canis]|uniref:NR LBD domain-containing protein n=1 Tax=Toxocara canis TaxID=6265 RepID=A0A183TY67_TOXCA|nr:unnamed protein product [Toxocara canis]
MVYAMHGATEVFSCNSELPYSIEDLRPMNFADFNGPTNVDLMMMFQYLRSLPFFLSLSSSDKKRTFQYFMAIDSMLTTAYLSMTLGRDNHWMVHFNGFYISMKPAPPSGDAPEDAIYLQRFSPEERKKYQLYMPMKLAQYTELCVPFAEINPTFVEYALLKLIALLLRGSYTLRKLALIVIGNQYGFWLSRPNAVDQTSSSYWQRLISSTTAISALGRYRCGG